MNVLFGILSAVSTIAWIAVVWHFSGSFVRTMQHRKRADDALRGAVMIAGVSVLLFQGRRLIFGAHLDMLPVSEEAYYVLALAISIAAGWLLIATDRRP